MILGNIIAEGHSNNSMFGLEDSVHRYNPTHMPRLLRQAFLEKGIEINTPDINKGRITAFNLYFEGHQVVDSTGPNYLVALENPNINRLNENREYCSRFNRVFAWDKRLFDLPNVVRILIPHPLACDSFAGFQERDIFSCLINANKAFREQMPTDLYLERLQTIRWYEKNAADKFELYGMGWGKPSPSFDIRSKLKRRIDRLRTQLFGYRPFPSYRGEVRDKGEILRRSRFSYCYENSRDLSNYITEKIFDSLVHGCVPVYWGADNVLEYIPADCFIDRRNFKDTAEVHRFLLSVTHEQYTAYQSQIMRFLSGDVAKEFRSERFVSTVVNHVVQDLQGASLQ